ncbi:MAG: type II toxin-antitoxin system YafQ family toxin [Alphaproteobacteria bacterium]|nr:type II toxin-antitoxin system YafQ family toxin [Alphaproteobacteria bacterium]
MRTINYTPQFKRDYRKLKGGTYRQIIDKELNTVFVILRNDLPLPQKYLDHPLKGRWRGHRECHIRPNLLLIYRKPNDQLLELTRIGSHSELSLV